MAYADAGGVDVQDDKQASKLIAVQRFSMQLCAVPVIMPVLLHMEAA